MDEQYNEIDTFCYNIRDGIANLIDAQIKVLKQTLCKQEFNKYDMIRLKMNSKKMIVNTNDVHVINDTDKNLVAAIADKEDVINECKRQLFDSKTYIIFC